MRKAAALFAFFLLSGVVAKARAGDPFEIQVYDGTANPPGVPGIELHVNDWATGNRESSPPEAPLHGQFHATLEPSLGILPFWELGAYLQGAVRTDDGVVDWAGVKLRSKFVTPPTFDPHWRLGVNFEVSYLPPTYEADRWGSEIRPIVTWHDDHWLFVANPILDQSFAGADAKQGPSFQPAVKAARTVGPVALGFEYYATLGPLTAILPWKEEQQQVFEVVDLVSVDRLEVNFGVGEGLTESSAGLVVKAIFGYEFDFAVSGRDARLPRAPSTADPPLCARAGW
ncbi:MAG TPA: hypothetical protein VGG39_29140 [Polyangiaceae bacterium]